MTTELITLRIQDKNGAVRQQAEGKGHCELVWYGSYEPGDIITVTAQAEAFVRLQIDQLIQPAVVYLKEGGFRFSLPFGSGKEPYPPEAFTGIIHELTAAYVEKTQGCCLLSENPMDVREETGVYPHCTASVETRGEAIFAARNTIDGRIITPGHGIWPYTSWGCGRDPDPFITIHFGRRVRLTEVRLYLRSDFPHDNYWKSGVLQFDDGSEVPILLEKTGACQAFLLEEPMTTQWVRLGRLIRDENDPSPFPALVQWQAYGFEV